jgi:hypothetical protein
MRSAQTWLSTIAKIAWVALRFVIFGLGGFFLLIFFSIEFMAGVRTHPFAAIIPLLVALAGALMMLFGVGEWGRWAYLWVFLSIPIAFFLISIVVPGDKGMTLGLTIAIAASASHSAARAYYRRRTPTVFRAD